MTISQSLETKRETLDTRIKVEKQGLIDRAAIVSNERAYIEFSERLDAPPLSNAKLQNTLQTLAPWDSL